MKNFTNYKPKVIASLAILMVLWQFSAVNAQTYNLPITGTDVVRCGAGELTLTVSDAGVVQNFNASNVKWYTVPFYGTPIVSGLTLSTGYIEFTHTYYVDYIGDDGCSQCDRLLIRAVVADQVITPQVIYPSQFYCNTANESFVPTVVGAEDGIWEISPAAGNSFNTGNGGFNPFGLGAGTYEVTFTPEEIEGCDSNPVTVSLTVTNAPEQPTISYAEENYCSNSPAVSVIRTGASGGTYSASPSGLTINSNSGLITPESSQTGSYTVTYLVPGGGGCAPVSATTSLSILKLPTAAISYSGPFTLNQGPQPVTLTGTDDFLGGDFSSTAGLTIDAGTGEINPSTSIAGEYTVTYTKSAVSPCSDVLIATTTVSILGLPSAHIDVSGQPVCLGDTDPEITFTGSAGATPYTFYYTINDGATQDISTDAEASAVTLNHPSLIAGTYVYKVTSVTDGNSSTRTYGTGEEPQITVTVTTPLVATFEYTGTPYCSNGTNPEPTYLGGGVAGTFSSTNGLVFVSDATGEINLSASTAGTYVVTNTIPATGGCDIITANTTVTITELPDAEFSYTLASYCLNANNPTPTITGDDGGIFSASPAGLIVDATTGEIDLANTSPGTYIIAYTIIAADGCALVSDDFEVEILSLPAANAGNNAGICLGQSIQIGVAPTQGSTYSWVSDPAGFTSTDAQPAVSPELTTTYTVTESNGTCSNTGSVTIFILDAPVANPIIGATALCAGSSALYTSTTYDETSNYTWSYSGTGATIGEQSILDEKVQVEITFSSSATSGTLTLTETANCATSNTLFIAVNPLPGNPNAGNINVVYDGTLKTGTATSSVLTIDQTTGASTGSVSATINWYDALTNGNATVAPSGTNIGTYTAYAEAVSPSYGCISLERTLVTVEITPAPLTITAHNYDKGFGEELTSPTIGSTAITTGAGQLKGDDDVTSVSLTYLNDVHTATKAVGTYAETIEPGSALGTGLTNYDITYVKGTMIIYEIIVESTDGTHRAGYNTMKAAYDAINAGTHTGEITIKIYANTTETATATLNKSGEGDASYTSVSIIPQSSVTITGDTGVSPVIILGNTNLLN